VELFLCSLIHPHDDWAHGNLFLISSETFMFLGISRHRSLYPTTIFYWILWKCLISLKRHEINAHTTCIFHRFPLPLLPETNLEILLILRVICEALHNHTDVHVTSRVATSGSKCLCSFNPREINSTVNVHSVGPLRGDVLVPLGPGANPLRGQAI
jgi:hypothetical protein